MFAPAMKRTTSRLLVHLHQSQSQSQSRYRQVRGLAGQIPQHRRSNDNTSEKPFDFTRENYERVETILAKYPSNYKQSATIPLLDLAQRQNHGFLSLSAMNKVAEVIGVNPMRVYETATFYTMFYREKHGKYIVQACTTTPCQACGADELLDAIKEHLGIQVGQTTPDGLFSLLEVECLGACANAPMIQVNDDYIECLTKDTVKEVLDMYKRGEPPVMTKWGSLPMNGQLSCEGPLGKTTLTSEFPGIQKFMRKEEELKGEVNPADIKKEMLYE